MAADGTCDRCGFSLAGLPAEFKVLPRHGKEVELCCPMCGERVSVVLQRLGILARGGGEKTQFLRWKVSTATQGGNVVTLPAGDVPGRFKLRFAELKPLEPREICFPRVPVFALASGGHAVPHLPVRKDYFDCVNFTQFKKDWDEGRRADIINGEYQVQLPLHGRDEAVQVRLPILTHRNAQGEEQRTFKDVNLKVWPNLPIKDWKYHLVGIAATGPGADALLGENRRIRAFAQGAGTSEWHPLNSTQRAGELLVGAITERPRWIRLELTEPGKANSETDEVQSGGYFYVPPVEAEASGQLNIGLDFGTSNTCMALAGAMVSDDSRSALVPKDVPDEKWNLYIFQGGSESRLHKGPDLWPSQNGFGPFKDLYASELLFNRTKAEQVALLSKVESWTYGLDYGIPAPGVELGFSEADFILGDFKWRELLQGSSFGGDNLKWIQSRYIAAALMNAYVRCAASRGRVHADRVDVKYSYPMSFDDGDLNNLAAAAQAAQDLLDSQTGLKWTIHKGADESAAAARNAGEPGAKLFVYLDMGGGSTDIGVKFERTPEKRETIYLTSVRYAGMSLLNSFEGESRGDSCLSGRVTVDVLRRKVRESSDVKSVFDDPLLFNKNRATVTRNRVDHFYGYLIEYVARLLAAGFLDQRFRSVVNGEEVLPNEIKIAIYFLGNGWRFKGWMADNVVKALRTQVLTRMQELLLDEQKRSPYAAKLVSELATRKIQTVAVDISANPELRHEKAAIAIGLLKDESTKAEKEIKRAGILGWQTSVEGSVPVPWFAMYRHKSGPPMLRASGGGDGEGFLDLSGASSSAEDETPWYRQHSTRPSLDWHDSAPALPPKLEKPFDLDPNLNMTRGVLRRSCWEGGEGWFTKGAYEVMLEDLFRPKLKGIGG